MAEKLLSPNQLAENLVVKPFTLLQYRMNGKGPKYIKLGHLVRNRLRPQQQHVAPVHVCRHRTLAKTELERIKVRPCPSSPPFYFYQVFLGFYSHIICF